MCAGLAALAANFPPLTGRGRTTGALELTTGRFFTPAGRQIDADGIKPDIEVLQDVPEEVRGQLKTEGEQKTGPQS